MAKRDVSIFSLVLIFLDIKCSNVCHIFVPQYEGLALADIMHEAIKSQLLMQHMPDEKEITKLPK